MVADCSSNTGSSTNDLQYWLRYGAGVRLMIRDFTVATTAIFVGTYVAIMAAVVTVGVLR